MNQTLKELILYLSGTEGFLTKEELFLGMRISKERKDVIKAIRILTEKVAQDFQDGDLTELANSIASGDIKTSFITKIERVQNNKRMGKCSIPINIEVIKRLAELSTNYLCSSCEGKRKKCLLRTDYKRLNEFGLYAPCQADEIEGERVGII